MGKNLHKELWLLNLTEREYLGDLGVHGKVAKKMDYEETGCRGLALIQRSDDWV
jgi:hypothetical protein